VDNLRHELHQLQVENAKSKSEMVPPLEVDRDKGFTEVDRLRSEVYGLQQELYEAQEKEVSDNDLLNKSRDDFNQLQYEHERVVMHCEKLTSELAQYWARYKQACKELVRGKERAQLEQYCVVKQERGKWERREATLYAQLEAAHASSITGTSTKTLGTNMMPVGLGLEAPGLATSSPVSTPNWLEPRPLLRVQGSVSVAA